MFKLLIIDDEKLIREGLVNYIDWSSLEIEVVGTAANGQTALGQIFEKRPDLIISDIKMPTMDGIDMLKCIREKRIPSEVIFISAYSNFDYAQSALKLGAFDYILKPVEENVLIEIVTRCVNRIREAKQREWVLTTIKAEDSKKIPPLYNELSTGKQDLSSEIPVKSNKKLVNMALEFIDKNYSRDISLNDVANVLYITPSYLSKIFSEEIKEGFSRYLIKYRIAKAKELLGDHKYKVYQVAELVGYNDVCHFTKIFKEYEGVTPARYREL